MLTLYLLSILLKREMIMPEEIDPKPYVAKDGTRFAPDQAKVMTVFLRYAPRPKEEWVND